MAGADMIALANDSQMQLITAADSVSPVIAIDTSAIDAGDAHAARSLATARVVATIAPRLNRVLRGNVRALGGLSMPQFVTLRMLRHGALSAGALAEKFDVSRPTITRMVDGLVKKGLVDRNGDLTDRRVQMVSLTTAGRELQGAGETAAENYLATLLSQAGDAELDRMVAAFGDLAAVLNQASHQSSGRLDADRRRSGSDRPRSSQDERPTDR